VEQKVHTTFSFPNPIQNPKNYSLGDAEPQETSFLGSGPFFLSSLPKVREGSVE